MTPNDACSETLSARLEELDKRISQRFDLIDRATDLALRTMDKRLDGMNEFREALREQQDRFADRKELDLRIKPLEAFQNETRGRVAVTIWGIGLFFVVVQIVIRILWNR